jgi:outer membrane protein assembly factor BamE (lipoprotein component of BamABCDE complex)
LLTGCTTTGNSAIENESEESIGEKIQEGITTQAQINKMLGDPIDVTFINDGKEVWTYEMSRIKPLARNFIPYASIFTSGSNSVEQKLTILFDHAEVVEKYTWIESETERRSGILVSP